RSFDLAFGREVTMERGVISGKRGEAGTDGGRLLMDSARSFPSERGLLFDRGGKGLGVWTRAGAVPSNRAQEAVRQFLDKKGRQAPAAGEPVWRWRHVATLKPPVERNGRAAPVRTLAFSPDGKQVLTSTLEDGAFRLWGARTGKPCRRA